MGWYGSNGRGSRDSDCVRGWAFGMLDMLSPYQRREEGCVEEVVLDDSPGHRGDIRR